jgi:hypothetical protein
LQKICRLFQGFKILQELCLNFCVFDQSFGQWMRERQQQELLLPYLFFLSKFEGGQVYWIYRVASEKPVEQRRKIQWSPVEKLAMVNNLAKELKPYHLDKMKVQQWMTCTWLQQAEAWISLRISLRVKREDWWWPYIISLGRCKMCIFLYLVAFLSSNMFGSSAPCLEHLQLLSFQELVELSKKFIGHDESIVRMLCIQL